MEIPVLKVIIKTFIEIFPDAHLYLGNFNVNTPGLALVGHLAETRFGSDWFEQRVASQGLRATLGKEALIDGYRFFSGYLGGREELLQFSNEANINTDDMPIVMYQAPKIFSKKSQEPAQRLSALLEAMHPKADALTRSDSGARDFSEALELVWQARNIFLRGAMADTDGRHQDALDLYLESAKVTPHFLVSYAYCLQMILKHAETDPKGMKQLAYRLLDARPEIEDAKIILEEVFGETVAVPRVKTDSLP
jgi:spermidine synthase